MVNLIYICIYYICIRILYIHTYIYTYIYIYIYIYMHAMCVHVYVCMCVCLCVYVFVYVDRLWHAFEETNEWFWYYFKSLFDLVSGFLEPKLQLKISKNTIIHLFNWNSTRDKLPVYIFSLLFGTAQSELTLLGLALLYKGNFSNATVSFNLLKGIKGLHYQNCHKYIM